MATGSVEINFVSEGVVQWAFDKIVSCSTVFTSKKYIYYIITLKILFNDRKEVRI